MLYRVYTVPSASKLSSKFLIYPRLRLGQMFTFRTISQPRACITQYNIPRKWFIHKIFIDGNGIFPSQSKALLVKNQENS